MTNNETGQRYRDIMINRLETRFPVPPFLPLNSNLSLCLTRGTWETGTTISKGIRAEAVSSSRLYIPRSTVEIPHPIL